MKYEMKPLTDEEAEAIGKKISEYADSMAPNEPHTEEEQLVFKIENEEGRMIAGCVLNIHLWGRAVLAQLWADEQYRGQGLGSTLIHTAQKAAREKGCYYLCLGTLDFMARPLYEKHGFKVFTENIDLPKGHTGWSMSKRLDKEIPDYIPTTAPYSVLRSCTAQRKTQKSLMRGLTVTVIVLLLRPRITIFLWAESSLTKAEK